MWKFYLYLILMWVGGLPLLASPDLTVQRGSDQTITGNKTFSGLLNVTGRFEATSPASTYLFGTFDNNKGLIFSASADGKKWLPITTTYSATDASNLRDPSWIKIGGTYYVAYTLAFPTVTNSFKIIKSTDLVNWSTVATPSIEAVPDGQAWAPEWFYDDAINQYYLVVAGVSTGSVTMKLYVMNPTSTDFSTWSSAREITGASLPTKMIDGFIQKQGSTYYLFYNNNNTGYIEVATSTSRESGYTVIKTGNWSGWGSGYQGPSLVSLPDGRWRIYIDSYSAINGNKLFYADSSSSDLATATWSALTAATGTTGFVGPYEHGTARRVGDLQTEQVISALDREVVARTNQNNTFAKTTTLAGNTVITSTVSTGTTGSELSLFSTGITIYSSHPSGWSYMAMRSPSGENGVNLLQGSTFLWQFGTRADHSFNIRNLNGGDYYSLNITPAGVLTINQTHLNIGTAGYGVAFQSGSKILSGSGSPEGAVTAPVGSLYLRSDGGAGTTLYVKQSGSGNTGWVGK